MTKKEMQVKIEVMEAMIEKIERICKDPQEYLEEQDWTYEWTYEKAYINTYAIGIINAICNGLPEAIEFAMNHGKIIV